MIIKGAYADAVIMGKDWYSAIANDSYYNNSWLSTEKQIREIINSPCSENSYISIMPDCHVGVGCCVGFTQRFTNRVVPNFVGCDIGCGMLYINIDKCEARKINLEKIDKIIKQQIPSGDKRSKILDCAELIDYSRLTAPINKTKVMSAIGTLGGGNHFIEMDKDEDGNFYLVIHSGSRHLGYSVWEYWQKVASSKRPKGVSEHLAWLEGDDLIHYIEDIKVCQQYSLINKEAIAEIILSELGIKPKNCEKYVTNHNYIDLVNNIIRKGSINGVGHAIIPINMHDGSLLVYGKSTEDYNWSLPHGAGRLMSRAQAKESLNMKDYKSLMKGIFSSCINIDTIDESPMVYKSIDFIKNQISDYANIISIIKPIYNFKSSVSK